MSINRLFNDNGYVLYCDEMHCKNVVPPTGGQQGDIFAVNTSNQSVFTKTIEGTGPSQPLQIKNMPLYVLSDNGLGPAVLGVGSDAPNGMPAIIGMGNLATQDSFFFAYDDTNKELALGQNNACVDHDFTTNLNNGHLVLNNKLKLPTVTPNNILKLDNNNVVTNATNTDFNNFYNNDGTISDATRTINGNGADINIDNVSIFTNNSARNIINANSRVEINTPTILLTQQTNGFLYSDNTGNVTATTLNGNLISSYTQLVPGNYNIVVPSGATNCTISAVGGGGGSCFNAGFASPGGGAGGAIINYPSSVSPGQTINVTVGQGGAVNADGTDTIIVLGTHTITCGKGLTSTNQTNGGNGGSVTLWTGNTIIGGLGGNFQAVGNNGNISYFVYTGSGGGGIRANGGNNILFIGGLADANYGGGGASAFANGANNHANGSLGSGGGADNGIGGNGFVQINFFS